MKATPSGKQLVLIDGTNYMYRAWHAMTELKTKHGEHTGAIHGVVNMLQIHIKERPARIAFVMDGKGPTFRHEMYEEYKANRPKQPLEIRSQTKPLRKIVQALGITLIVADGVEADDVIGTLATKGLEKGYDVTISTGDKDFSQLLVSPNIRLMNTMTRTIMRTSDVLEKYGIEASQFADYLALMGDMTDNIPGIKGCGPKTAVQLLKTYGSVSKIVKKAPKIKGAVGEKIRACLDDLKMSKRLSVIKTDCKLEHKLEDLRLREPDAITLRRLYTRYELKQALERLGDSTRKTLWG